MTQSHAAEGGDLVDLAARLRALDLETGLTLSLALRKSRRERHSIRSLKGAETRRMKEMEGITAPAAFGVTALSPSGSSPAVSPASPLQSAGADDWDPCPVCKFILVACDCDAPLINLEHRHAA